MWFNTKDCLHRSECVCVPAVQFHFAIKNTLLFLFLINRLPFSPASIQINTESTSREMFDHAAAEVMISIGKYYEVFILAWMDILSHI